jgi:hypothetical protein
VASKSKLLRVGSVEHRNRNHPLARVILSGLSIEHLGVKFCRGKSRDAISIAWINKRTIAFGGPKSSSPRENRDDEVTSDGSVNCSIVRNRVIFDETVFDHFFEFRIFFRLSSEHICGGRVRSHRGRRGDLSATAVIAVARRQHRALVPEVEALSGG